MTQAMNLANFSNNLDVSGQVTPTALNAPVPISKGGTNSATAAGARTNLGSTTVGDAVFIASSQAAAQSAMGVVVGTNVPSITGTGASGTWGINISGNAATATAATNATNATTATTLSNASGAAPAYAVRAWATVTIPSNGGTVSLVASGNIASVTRSSVAVGAFYVTFTTPMPDANYDVNISAAKALLNNNAPMVQLFANNVTSDYTPPTTSGFYFVTLHSGNLNVQDCARICISVVR